MFKENEETESRLRQLQLLISMPLDLEYFGDSLLPKAFATYKDRIEHFEVRDSDVWITSFPRAGAILVQEMVWLLLNNFDYKHAASKPLDARCAYIEYNAVQPAKLKIQSDDVIMQLIGVTTRRFIVTYLPWTLLPHEIKTGTKEPKIIYIMRNVEDVLVSYHAFVSLFMEEPVSLEVFFKLFITNNYMYTPFWTNVLSYWRNRERKNLLIIRYDDMVRDMQSIISTVSIFLGVTVPEKEVPTLIKHLSYEELAKNPAINKAELLKALYPKDPKKQSIFAENEETNHPRDKLNADQKALIDYWSRKSTRGMDFDYIELGSRKT